MRNALVLGLLFVTSTVSHSATITSLNKKWVGTSGRLAITGTGFGEYAPGCQVLLGKIQMMITTWSDTRIVGYVREETPSGVHPLWVQLGDSKSNTVDLKVELAVAGVGRVKWRFEADDLYMMTRPVVAPDGTIYAKGINGHTYALRPNGSLKWVYNDGLTSPADMSLLPDGNIVIGGGNNVMALNPSGNRLWAVSGVGTQFLAGPTVGPDGHIYGATNPLYGGIGGFQISPDGQMVRTFSGLRGNSTGGSYPYAIAFGNGNWHFSEPRPRVGGGLPTLYALQLGGGLRWSRSGQGQPLALANGNIYTQVANDDNNYGTYRSSGTLAWAHSYNSFGVPQFFPHAGADGSVYQVAGGTQLVKFTPSGAVGYQRSLMPYTAQYPHTTSNGSLVLVSGTKNLSDPRELRAYRQDGSLAWNVQLPQEEGVFVSPISIMANSPDGACVYQNYTWNNYAPDRRCYLYAFDAAAP